LGRYTPSAKPSEPESLLPHIVKEFDIISVAINGNADGHIDMVYASPLRPKKGDIRYADGTTWNPGSGEGIYYYNAAGSWVAL